MNIYKLVIKVLLPKKCVPEKMSEQELYKIIRKRHCRNIALLKLYTFNKVYSLFVQYKQICKTLYLIRRLTKNNSQGLNSKNFKWLYHKSCQMGKEYVSFAFKKKESGIHHRIDWNVQSPFYWLGWLSYPYKNIFKTSVAGKRKKQDLKNHNRPWWEKL